MKCTRTVLFVAILTGMGFAGIVTMFSSPDYFSGIKQSAKILTKMRK